MTNIITISREFGSGGRELGKRLADALGYAYYDKEILEAIAKQTETDKWYAEKLLDEGAVSHIPLHFGRSFTYYSPITKKAVSLMVAERNVLKRLALKDNCILVGRNAQTVLENQNPFNIFVYADTASKIARCRQRAPGNENFSDKELINKMKQIDSVRAGVHTFPSEFSWGEKEGYHLCVNTSGLSIKRIAPLVAEYAKLWFEKQSE